MKESYKKDFIEDRIKNHPIWQSLFFWEEYFWDTIAINFQTVVEGLEGEEYSEKEKDYLKKALKKYAIRMLGWGELRQESVAMFTENMADSIGLDGSQTQAILASMSKTQALKSKKQKKIFKNKMKILSARSKDKTKEGETPEKPIKDKQHEKPEKPEKLEKFEKSPKSPKSEKQDKLDKPFSPRPEKQPKPEKTEKPEKPEKPEKLKLSSEKPVKTAPPQRPVSAPPVMCEKCRLSFHFKYELATHVCEKAG